MNAQTAYQLETRPACVLAHGPFETDGDGGFEFVVCFGDQDGEPIDENRRAIWKLWDNDEVGRFAANLAAQFNLELIDETTPV